MPALAQEDDEPIHYLGQLVFPDYCERMIRALRKLETIEEGKRFPGAYYRFVAEEFYPHHVNEVVKIMTEHWPDMFLAGTQKGTEENLAIRRRVYAQFDRLGIPCIW